MKTDEQQEDEMAKADVSHLQDLYFDGAAFSHYF